MEETEIWKDVVGYEGDYQVSNLGRVRSLKYGKERMMKPIKNNREYLIVNLYKNGKNKQFLVHILVAMAFLGHTPNGHSSVVDHINSDKTDNRLENLRIVSHRENTTFGYLKKETSSRYPGVVWYKPTKKWRARIRINRKLKYLGCFTSEEEAAQAYEKALNNL